jgi:hypothetical protein
MIKKKNNIRIGGNIYIVENFNDDEYLLRDIENKTINWVSKSLLHKSLEKLTFKSALNESIGEKRYFFKNNHLTVQINPINKGSVISVLTENAHWAKHYDYTPSRTLYEFNKFFNYVNELTPYKLTKYGFKKLKGSN